MVNAGLSREEALEKWEEEGKTKDSFRWAYKKLKDGLLDGILSNNFNYLESDQKAIIECWKRLAQIKTLMVTGRMDAAMDIAVETVRLAEKCGLTEIAGSLSENLMFFHGIIKKDKAKFRRYRRKLRVYSEQLYLERKSKSLYVEIAVLFTNGEDFNHLLPELKELDQIKTDSYKFHSYRYSSYIWYYIKNNNYQEIISTCHEAINFLNKSAKTVPFEIVFSYYNKLIPYLLFEKKYALAESKINECSYILSVAKGGQNWHVNLILKAKLGFQSNKPMMAYQAWKMAEQYPIDRPVIVECWEIVHAYLDLYNKLGLISIPEKFRLARFLNSVTYSEQDKTEANVAILIVTLLHHLIDGDYEAYLKKAESLPAYWQAHLRGPLHERKKYFLKLLEKIYRHHFKRYRMETMVKKDLRNFKDSKAEISLDAISAELVPYETLWEIALGQLK